MNIDKELIFLAENYNAVTTATASVSSLDERGRSMIYIKGSGWTEDSKTSEYGVLKKKFIEMYEFNNDSRGCFILFRLKSEYKKIAEKHRRALDVLQELEQ